MLSTLSLGQWMRFPLKKINGPVFLTFMKQEYKCDSWFISKGWSPNFTSNIKQILGELITFKFSGDLRGNRSYFIRLNSLNVRNYILGRSVTTTVIVHVILIGIVFSMVVLKSSFISAIWSRRCRSTSMQSVRRT